MSREIDNPTITSLVTAKRTQIEIILEHLLLRIETRIGETRTRPINYNLRMGYKVPACNPLHEASNPPGVHSRGKSSTTSGSTNEQEDGTAGTSHLTHPRATAKIRKPHLLPLIQQTRPKGLRCFGAFTQLTIHMLRIQVLHFK